jgi:hypothetical protein
MSPFRILDCGLLLPLNLKSKAQNPKSILGRVPGIIQPSVAAATSGAAGANERKRIEIEALLSR